MSNHIFPYWVLIYPILLVLTLYLIKWYEKNKGKNYRKLLKLALAFNFVIVASFFAPWTVIKNNSIYGFELILSGNLLVAIPFTFYLLATYVLIKSNTNIRNWISFGFFVLGEISFLIGIFKNTWGLGLLEGFQDITFIPVLAVFLTLFNFVAYCFILEWRPKNKTLREFVNLKFFRKSK